MNVSHLWDLCSSVFFELIRPILTCSTARVTSVMLLTSPGFNARPTKPCCRCPDRHCHPWVTRNETRAPRHSPSSFTLFTWLRTSPTQFKRHDLVQLTDQPLELVLADTCLLPVHLHGHRIWLLHESLEVLQQRTSKHFLASGTADSRTYPRCLCNSGYSKPLFWLSSASVSRPGTVCVKF